ncbi:hypothetical protein D3C80_1149020 [compost metagenome]
MPLRGRRHAKQRVDFREQHFQRATVAKHLEKDLRIARRQGIFRLFPHAFRREVFQLARRSHRGHQRQGFIGNAEAQMGVTRSKSRDAQNA